MNLYKTKGVLGSWNQWFSYINEKKIKEIKISARFAQFLISSWREKGHEPRRAELKILQLEFWLEPARLGLITTSWCNFRKATAPLSSTNVHQGMTFMKRSLQIYIYLTYSFIFFVNMCTFKAYLTMMLSKFWIKELQNDLGVKS